MPTYEYVCLECQNQFEAYAPVASRDAGRDCPQCGARQVKRRLSTFFARSHGNGGSVSLGGG